MRLPFSGLEDKLDSIRKDVKELRKQVQFYATLETSEIVFAFEHALIGCRGEGHGGEGMPQPQTVAVEEMPQEDDASHRPRRAQARNPRHPGFDDPVRVYVSPFDIFAHARCQQEAACCTRTTCTAHEPGLQDTAAHNADSFVGRSGVNGPLRASWATASIYESRAWAGSRTWSRRREPAARCAGDDCRAYVAPYSSFALHELMIGKLDPSSIKITVLLSSAL